MTTASFFHPKTLNIMTFRNFIILCTKQNPPIGAAAMHLTQKTKIASLVCIASFLCGCASNSSTRSDIATADKELLDIMFFNNEILGGWTRVETGSNKFYPAEINCQEINDIPPAIMLQLQKLQYIDTVSFSWSNVTYDDVSAFFENTTISNYYLDGLGFDASQIESIMSLDHVYMISVQDTDIDEAVLRRLMAKYPDTELIW